jgi:hypothetical protein
MNPVDMLAWVVVYLVVGWLRVKNYRNTLLFLEGRDA